MVGSVRATIYRLVLQACAGEHMRWCCSMPMKSCMRDAPGTLSENLIANRSCDKLLLHTLAGEPPPAVCCGVQGESQHTAAANTCMCRIHIAQKCIVFPVARGLLACRLCSIRSAVTVARICETKMVVLVPPGRMQHAPGDTSVVVSVAAGCAGVNGAVEAGGEVLAAEQTSRNADGHTRPFSGAFLSHWYYA